MSAREIRSGRRRSSCFTFLRDSCCLPMGNCLSRKNADEKESTVEMQKRPRVYIARLISSSKDNGSITAVSHSVEQCAREPEAEDSSACCAASPPRWRDFDPKPFNALSPSATSSLPRDPRSPCATLALDSAIPPESAVLCSSPNAITEPIELERIGCQPDLAVNKSEMPPQTSSSRPSVSYPTPLVRIHQPPLFNVSQRARTTDSPTTEFHRLRNSQQESSPRPSLPSDANFSIVSKDNIDASPVVSSGEVDISIPSEPEIPLNRDTTDCSRIAEPVTESIADPATSPASSSAANTPAGFTRPGRAGVEIGTGSATVSVDSTPLSARMPVPHFGLSEEDVMKIIQYEGATDLLEISQEVGHVDDLEEEAFNEQLNFSLTRTRRTPSASPASSRHSMMSKRSPQSVKPSTPASSRFKDGSPASFSRMVG